MKNATGSMNRRDLFATAMTAGAASIWATQPAQAEEAVQREEQPQQGSAARQPIIDTNVHLFQWPFRRLPLDETGAFVKKLRDLGITEAWAGSFEGILHRDIAGVNARLAEACRKHPELVPLGSINPELPDWQEDLRRCLDEYNMPGVRLHPSYHGYALTDSRFEELLERATTAGRFVQITAAMEDPRTQHPMMQVADVDLAPLPNLMRSIPDARVQILGARPRPQLLERVAELPGISFDTSRVEGTDGIVQLVRTLSAERVMFGSHAPFLIPEAALIRIHESDLGEENLRLLLAKNAQQAWSEHDG